MASGPDGENKRGQPVEVMLCPGLDRLGPGGRYRDADRGEKAAAQS